MRHREALRALACIDLPPERIHCLGCVDQEAIQNISELVSRLVSLLRRLRPDILITHAYEGGHPDHDAAALIAILANGIIESDGESVPRLMEMASYRAQDGALVTGEFLQSQPPAVILEFAPADCARKRRMLSCYQSQSAVLQSFSSKRELLRTAPFYDFTQPPHAGRLWYECLNWPMTGSQWRELATASLREFEPTLCR